MLQLEGMLQIFLCIAISIYIVSLCITKSYLMYNCNYYCSLKSSVYVYECSLIGFSFRTNFTCFYCCREANHRAHSKPGTVERIPERKKHVVKELE